jgi:hypothetical protein
MLSDFGRSGLINGHTVTQTELYIVIQPLNQPRILLLIPELVLRSTPGFRLFYSFWGRDNFN